jgi:predicted O-methyltransferase YrrM
MKFNEDAGRMVDEAHAELIYGLVYSHKPDNILELGLGGGRSLDAILQSAELNNNSPSITVVDDWSDWGGVIPPGVYEAYEDRVELVNSSEKDFVFSTNKKYDFIMSDADHYHTNEWFDHVYDNLLNSNGILIYHDINLFEDEWFINLREIYETCKTRSLHHFLFNKNSRPGERCHRGLLVIFKNT